MQSPTTQTKFTDIVSLEKYPIDRLDSPAGKGLIEQCQQQIRTEGIFSLPNFLTPQGLAGCLSLAHAVAPLGYRSKDRHNPIFSRDDHSSLPAQHPWRQYATKQVSFVANDAIPPDSILQQLFDWPAISNFVAATLGYDQLYPLSDPFGALSMTIMDHGDHLGWHFDTNDFIVALPLQTAAQGGLYEYCPYIWDHKSPDWQSVTDTINGDRRLVKRFPYDAGSLIVFCGHYSLHRVTEVVGSKTRMIALLSYHHDPKTTLSESSRMQVYGKKVS